ncbi:unnamed protein product [Cercospora beticola]|nr:unnamed protein product [Cercospora beticola]
MKFTLFTSPTDLQNENKSCNEQKNPGSTGIRTRGLGSGNTSSRERTSSGTLVAVGIGGVWEPATIPPMP